MEKINRESDWYVIFVCRLCKARMSDNERMYSNGICKHCGHDGDVTICDTRRVRIKAIKHYNWWQLFNRKTTYIGRDQFSKDWLSENV